MTSPTIDISLNTRNGVAHGTMGHADIVGDRIGHVELDTGPAASVRREQTWAHSLKLVHSAAALMQRYETTLRTMANDVIRLNFRSNAEKDALEKTLEKSDKSLEELRHEHQLALDLLHESHMLCLTLKTRLEQHEQIPAEVERDFHYAERYFSKMKHAVARRAELSGVAEATAGA